MTRQSTPSQTISDESSDTRRNRITNKIASKIANKIANLTEDWVKLSRKPKLIICSNEMHPQNLPPQAVNLVYRYQKSIKTNQRASRRAAALKTQGDRRQIPIIPLPLSVFPWISVCHSINEHVSKNRVIKDRESEKKISSFVVPLSSVLCLNLSFR